MVAMSGGSAPAAMPGGSALSTIPEGSTETSTSTSELADEQMADVDAMSVDDCMEVVAPQEEPMSVDIVPAARAAPTAADSPVACCADGFKNGDAASFGKCAIA